MKYALLDGQYVTATPHQKGAVCPLCKSEMVARCGAIKVHHWAHKKGAHCDSWRESDTEWRHHWLDQFSDCQIEAVIGSGKEKHFADIQTKSGTNVLLRQGKLKESEIAKMEDFFPGLVWIVGLSASKRAAITFLKAFKDEMISPSFDNVWRTFGTVCLPSEWTHNRYPIFFDLSGVKGIPHFVSTEPTKYLWCLMPYEANSLVYDRCLLRYTKEEMVELLKKRKFNSATDVQKKVSSLNKKHLKKK